MKLQKLIDQYVAHQKSLGARMRRDGGYLGAFSRFMGARKDVVDIRTHRVEAFLNGAGPVTQTWFTKHSVLRGFYRYAVSPGYVAVAPLPTVIPRRPPAFVPYIYSHDDLRRLLLAADLHRHPHASLDPMTIRAIVLLLYGTGLRGSEAINLNRSDVDCNESLLTIRETKFGKARLVPFGLEVGRILSQYARRKSVAITKPFFMTRKGARVKHDTLQQTFRLLCDRAGIRREAGARFQPRLHDLRHTFAVHRLISWYRQGANVQRLLPQLSTYLGHIYLKHTQVYLTMTPELLHEASQRFEHYADTEVRHD